MLGNALGKYQLLEALGRGGIGAVYKAFDPTLERTVAIKVLAPQLVWQTEFAKRFMREARSAAKLNHPNLIHIYDVGQDGDWYYFVMTYLPGGSLRRLVQQQGHLAVSEVITNLRPIGNALDYTHSKGLVHRNVKPTNIMFDERGQPVLSDFGIDKAAQETKQKVPGASIGTPQYMAPEQVLGKAVGRRTDQYSLGIVAFELLSGHVPFDADSIPALLHKQAYDPAPPVRSRSPEMPAEVDKVLSRALAKSPSDRYASCSEFVNALADALHVPASVSPDKDSAATIVSDTERAIAVDHPRPSTLPQQDRLSAGTLHDVSAGQHPGEVMGDFQPLGIQPAAPSRWGNRPEAGNVRTWQVVVGVLALVFILAAGAAVLSTINRGSPIPPTANVSSLDTATAVTSQAIVNVSPTSEASQTPVVIETPKPASTSTALPVSTDTPRPTDTPTPLPTTTPRKTSTPVLTRTTESTATPMPSQTPILAPTSETNVTNFRVLERTRNSLKYALDYTIAMTQGDVFLWTSPVYYDFVPRETTIYDPCWELGLAQHPSQAAIVNTDRIKVQPGSSGTFTTVYVFDLDKFNWWLNSEGRNAVSSIQTVYIRAAILPDGPGGVLTNVCWLYDMVWSK